jgi:NAD-dependent deacetylase
VLNRGTLLTNSFPCSRVRELLKSRCDRCSRPPFYDAETYDPPAELPRCDCGGRFRPHICWFGELPFELDRIFRELDECTIFMAVGCRASGELRSPRGW